ncbi:hypothetical protein BDW22DRAFT_1481935 [Trametopsis cervina]|nr:hypothetical protein BDW22DRAFT_1481935 [Trametopsis cervina]
MGFFSSRRPEQLEEHLNNDNTVVRVIRSRFYGKQKGKEHEAQQHASSSASASANSTIGLQPDSFSIHDTANLHPHKADRYQPAASSSLKPRPPLPITAETTRTSTDVVTITLAQRLNELAVANNQGLLDDDEYRLLRQNLFERLAGGSAVPSEVPIVPVSTSSRDHSDVQAPSAHQRRSSSVVQGGTRTPSLSSKRSFTSTVSGFIRRGSTKRRTSMVLDSSMSDAGSVISTPRTPDRFTFAVPMSKQQSVSSLRVENTRSIYDGDTLSSRHTMYERTPASQVFRPPPTPERTVRRLPSVPPSSFPGGHLSPEAKNAHMSIIDTLEEDDERLQTSAEIRQEIDHVEAEGRRLLDAFNGLELSTLVRQQRQPGNAPLASASFITSPMDVEAPWRSYPAPVSASAFAAARTGKDPDVVSIISASSGRTALSQSRTPSVRSRPRQLNPSNGALVFQPVTLSRKTSMSSISSRHKNGTAASNSLGRMGLGSSSSLNLRGSSAHLPLATVSEAETAHPSLPLKMSSSAKGSLAPLSPNGSHHSESIRNLHDDEDIQALQAEMAEIRRRRAEVTARYEARIEYLRARLKGAELREKLLKR